MTVQEAIDLIKKDQAAQNAESGVDAAITACRLLEDKDGFYLFDVDYEYEDNETMMKEGMELYVNKSNGDIFADGLTA